jgi:NADH:ubiquinone oxidoreductase subunit 5 (subunit L)/multisubunit Na+/H+ antiporter MnhA subunit
MAHVATLILLMPLVGFLLVMLLGQYLKEEAVGYLATGVVGVSFVLTVVAFFLLLGHSTASDGQSLQRGSTSARCTSRGVAG